MILAAKGRLDSRGKTLKEGRPLLRGCVMVIRGDGNGDTEAETELGDSRK